MEETSQKRFPILPIGFVFLIALYPIVFLFFQNINELSLHEVWLPALISIIMGLVFMAIFWIINHSLMKSALLSGFLLFFLMNYRLLEKPLLFFFPNLKPWYSVPIVCYIFFVLMVLFSLITKNETHQTILSIFSLVLVALILLNVVIGLFAKEPKIEDEAPLAKNTESQQNITNTASPREYPNIYYLIFDEYSGFHAIQNVYNYDNAIFRDFLTENNFSISEDSHNESVATRTVLHNLLSLDYVVENHHTIEEAQEITGVPYLYTYLEQKGYQIHGIGETEYIYLEDTAGKEKNVTEAGDTFAGILLKNSLVYPLYERNQRLLQSNQVLTAFDEINHLEIPAEDEPMFTFLYVVSPHVPFLFKEDGSPANPTDSVNWDNPEVYLGQFKYITTRIMETLEILLEQDPNAVIILQSDHAARKAYTLDAFEMTPENKTNILNAVYMQGDPIAIEGLSGVNTLRTIFNELFDDTLEFLEVPSYEENTN